RRSTLRRCVPFFTPRSDRVRDPGHRRSGTRPHRASRGALPRLAARERQARPARIPRNGRALGPGRIAMRLLELEDPGWVEFVRGRREATLFHHHARALLLGDYTSFRAMALAFIDSDGAVTTALPVGVV